MSRSAFGKLSGALLGLTLLASPLPARAASVLADVKGLSSVESFIASVSPSKEGFIARSWPVLGGDLKPVVLEYPWKEMGVNVTSFTLTPVNLVKVKEYENLIPLVSQELEAKPAAGEVAFKEEKTYLLADLLFAVSSEENPKSFQKAYDAYRRAIEAYPSSPRAIAANYHIDILLLKMGRYAEASYKGHSQDARWANEPLWAMPFRSVVMEAYYMRGRYVRAEDYLWELAARINKDELTGHLARRYADSLYWQGKYAEVAKWYENASITPFLDDSSDSALLSRLYLAEALYQLGRGGEALPHYKAFKEKYRRPYPASSLDYRILQCRFQQDGDAASAMKDFYTMGIQEKPDRDIDKLAKIQWARLVARSGDTAQYGNAHVTMETLMRADLRPQILREAVFVKAMLEWRLGEEARAYKTVLRVIPKVFTPSEADGLLAAASDAATVLLLRSAQSYWDKKDTVGFLLQADHLRYAIELSRYKANLLVWVGRAYVESGMVSAGARLFQRLLFESTPDYKSAIAVELARVYGIMGEGQLMGKALDLVTEVPTDPELRDLYYTTQASYDMNSGNYGRCMDQFDTLLSKGVKGDEFFKFSIQGAVCARKAKKFEKASKLIGLLGLESGNIQKPELPQTLQQLQKEAFFEKVNLLAEMGSPQEAIALFEELQSVVAGFNPPIETLFLMISAYRGQHQPDKAIELWRAYGSQLKDLPEDFKKQYTEILETLARVELLPIGE